LLNNRLNTVTGIEMAKKRHIFMEQFLLNGKVHDSIDSPNVKVKYFRKIIVDIKHF